MKVGEGYIANLSLPCLELLLHEGLTKGSLWFLMLVVEHGLKGKSNLEIIITIHLEKGKNFN